MTGSGASESRARASRNNTKHTSTLRHETAQTSQKVVFSGDIFGRARANFARFRPIVGHVWPSVGQCWAISAEIWPTSTEIGPRLDRILAVSTEFGPNPAKHFHEFFSSLAFARSASRMPCMFDRLQLSGGPQFRPSSTTRAPLRPMTNQVAPRNRTASVRPGSQDSAHRDCQCTPTRRLGQHPNGTACQCVLDCVRARLSLDSICARSSSAGLDAHASSHTAVGSR